jgi:hypothetical protein
MMGQLGPVPVAAPQAVQPASDVLKHEPTIQHAVQMTSGPRYGHADDYSWLVGTLQRVNVPDGRWKIRYCPLDVVDRWGGSVILAQDARVDQFKEGDAVFVKGEILADRPSLYVAGPLYRIHSIENDSVR